MIGLKHSLSDCSYFFDWLHDYLLFNNGGKLFRIYWLSLILIYLYFKMSFLKNKNYHIYLQCLIDLWNCAKNWASDHWIYRGVLILHIFRPAQFKWLYINIILYYNMLESDWLTNILRFAIILREIHSECSTDLDRITCKYHFSKWLFQRSLQITTAKEPKHTKTLTGEINTIKNRIQIFVYIFMFSTQK